MYFDNQLWIAKNDNKICMLPSMANRHGLICGATGTGKTITLKVLAESFSDAGVPCFVADIKGDLSGMSKPGVDSEGMQKRIERFGLAEANFTYKSYPTSYWDVFGKKGTPVRATVSEMGPLLLGRIMSLNDVQEGILNIIFRIADDQNLLLLDLKDLKAMTQYVGDNASAYKTQYGNISAASIGAIQRAILRLEDQGGDIFFGEPALEISDWIRCDEDGRGYVNVMNCEQLFQQPQLYATFLLWMLSEIYNLMPEVGDPEKPKFVFFFDEAHLLFNNASREMLEKVEQVVRLIRSKGVGIYFISQNPSDIPNTVLSQLGNRIEHALRAYSPAELKNIKTAAQTFRPNPAFDTAEAIQACGTGEAVIQFLDEKGAPRMVERAFILPPQSLMGPVDEVTMTGMIATSDMGQKYNMSYDRESAYELLTGRVSAAPAYDASIPGAYNPDGAYSASIPGAYNPDPMPAYSADIPGAYNPGPAPTAAPAGNPFAQNTAPAAPAYNPQPAAPAYDAQPAPYSAPTYSAPGYTSPAPQVNIVVGDENQNRAAMKEAAYNAAYEAYMANHLAQAATSAGVAAAQAVAAQIASMERSREEAYYAANPSAPRLQTPGSAKYGPDAKDVKAIATEGAREGIELAKVRVAEEKAAQKAAEDKAKAEAKEKERLERELAKAKEKEEARKEKEKERKARDRERIANRLIGSAASSIGGATGRKLARGILGSLMK